MRIAKGPSLATLARSLIVAEREGERDGERERKRQ